MWSVLNFPEIRAGESKGKSARNRKGTSPTRIPASIGPTSPATGQARAGNKPALTKSPAEQSEAAAPGRALNAGGGGLMALSRFDSDSDE